MKPATLLLACCGLVACSTPPTAPGVSADARATAAAASCPDRAGTDMHTALPAPHFLPAAPPGSALVLPARLRANTPAYPSASMRCHEEGKVTITYCVRVDGSVENVQVVVSSGFARLDNAVLGWASTDRHRPGTVNGQPRRYCGLTIDQAFELDVETPEQAKLPSGSGGQ